MSATLLARPSLATATATTPQPQLSINTTPRGTAAAVPNKHIPFCSPGVNTPPATPPPPTSHSIDTTTLTYPPNAYHSLSNDPALYSITAAQLSQAIHHLSAQPLPPPKQVFPWLHGLHSDNQLQLAFFTARKKSLRRTPTCIRSITVVKAGGDLSHCKIKGAIAPDELLKPGQSKEEAEFLDPDPKDGFSVRNFQIQAGKLATVSDIIVYGDHHTPHADVERLAQRISRAQIAWQRRTEGGSAGRLFNTFVLSGKSTRVLTSGPRRFRFLMPPQQTIGWLWNATTPIWSNSTSKAVSPGKWSTFSRWSASKCVPCPLLPRSPPTSG
jgi:dual specificity MAP kinase phosphatase